MAVVIESIYDFYNHVFTTLRGLNFVRCRDPRSDELFIIRGSPLGIVLVLSAYCALCKFGPMLMANKKPIHLHYTMIIYNFLQVGLNLYLGVTLFYVLFLKHKFNFRCQEVDYSFSERGITEYQGTYAYFLLKIFDFCDTVFIILKKKSSQLSFLHCYHHFGICLASYIASKWVAGGPGAVLAVINIFVHVIMYFYYFITAFKPELKKSIWWKKYITQLQIIQFAVVASYFFQFNLQKNCNYPFVLTWVMFIQNLFMFILFSDFYRKTYLRKKSQ
ncbi:CLUMA_CG018739, isoform A [Clunio marinus]|uniref:Elongation of very long chain fatty acids protein n=1 Tax=Clunio marinus TaxID=568069 RepID=A0A1J1J1S3_9DIPT|nr:CLUMA_CG018739, isoform A [Clunio marinus]